jgi:alkylmercury lyase
MSGPTTQQLHATWTRRAIDTFRGGELSMATTDRLANGRPATAAGLAAATGRSLEQVRAYIVNAGRAGAEVADGTIVGNALTLYPTEHRFRVRGHDLFTWCGFDALFLPIMLGERAEVASTCPVTGEPIRLRVEPDGTVCAAIPDTVVVGIVGEEVTSCCRVAGPGSPICTQMPLFASRAAGERWQADHPGVGIVDLDDAREIARAYAQGCCR